MRLGDELASATCPGPCGFVIWTEREDRGVMCLCGTICLNGAGVDERSPTPGPLEPADPALLAAILDYEYAADPRGMSNPQQATADAWRARKRGGG